ncbi:MAG: MFS transporter [Myxococcales bacterium]|nr:MFS transporter [Myxococcales bacterium]
MSIAPSLSAPQARANINLYYAYTFFGNAAFWLSIHVVYFQSRGLSLSEIMWLLSAQSVSQALLEVPSGVFSDRFGRRRTLTIAAACKVLFCVLCMVEASLPVYLLGAACLGAHIAFESGTDAALVFETLSVLDRTKDYTKVKGRSFAFRMLGNGVGAIAGGYLAAADYVLPWALAAACCVIALALTLLLHEPGRTREIHHVSARTVISTGLQSLRSNRRLLRLLLLSATVVACILTGLRYQQPYLAQAGIVLERFGPVYLLWLLTSMAAAMSIGRWGPRLDERVFFFGLPALLGLQYLLLARWVGPEGIAIMLIGQAVIGIARPMYTTYINQEVDGASRATVLSVSGFVQNLLLLVLAPIVGWVGDLWSLSTAFVALAAVVVIGGSSLSLMLLWSSAPREVEPTPSP